jgi:class 3 adenylate cyclase
MTNSSELTEDLKLLMNCLVLADDFYVRWAFFLFSGGRITEHFDQSARDFLESFDQVKPIEFSFHQAEMGRMAFGEAVAKKIGDDDQLENSIQALKGILKSGNLYEYKDVRSPHFHIWRLVDAIRSIAAKIMDIMLPQPPFGEAHWQNMVDAVLQRTHLPRVIHDDISSIYEQASKTDSIVVFADIRKSQDLMTYAHDPNYFTEKMLTFHKEIKQILRNHNNIFDKFTGDGALIYFNQHLSSLYSSNYLRDFTSFCKKLIEFARPHFQEWGSRTQKLSPPGTGLALGADIGHVEYRWENDELVALGQPIVWANRMVSEGSPNEMIVNNRLMHTLKQMALCDPVELEGKTKSGESFLAGKITL